MLLGRDEAQLVYKTAIEQTVDGVALADMFGTIVFVNDSWALMHRYSASELIGKHLSVFHTEEQLESEVNPFLASLREKGSCSGEVGHRRKDGSTFTTWMTTTLLRDGDNEPLGLFALMRDFTEERRSTERLASLAHIVDIAPSIVVVRDPEGNTLYANESAVSMGGYNTDEFVALSIGDQIMQGNSPELENMVKEVEEKGQAVVELDLLKKDGSVVPLEILSKVIDWEGVRSVLSIGTDISERRRATRQLQQNLGYMSLLLQSGEQLAKALELGEILQVLAETATQLTDTDSAAIYTLEQEQLYLGATIPPLPPQFPEHLRGAHLSDHPTIEGVVRSGKSHVILAIKEAPLTDSEREVVDSLALRTLVLVPLIGSRGVLGVLIVGSAEENHDVSDLQLAHCRTLGTQAAIAIENAHLHNSLHTQVGELTRTEEALRESEEQYRALFTQMQQAVSVQEVVQDESGAVVDYLLVGGNESFERVFDISVAEEKGKSIRDINPGIPEDMIWHLGQVALTGEPYTQEYYSQRAARHLQVVSYSPRKGQFASIHTDITEMKLAEKRLIAANEDLAALNRYSIEQSACVTHEQLVLTIAGQLAEYSGAILVAVNEYDPEKKVLKASHIHTSKYLLSLATRLGGARMLRAESHVSDQLYEEMVASPIGHRATLSAATLGSVPRRAGKIFQSAAGLQHFAGVALVADGRLQATIVMGLADIGRIPPDSFLSSYALLSATSWARMKAEDKVRYMSVHDQLTGLSNRYFLEDEMKVMDTEQHWPLSVIMADVDGLKLTNDTYGHLHGDEVLKAVAACFSSSCRVEDIVARWGGDEYVLLLSQTDSLEAERVCSRIVANCSEINIGDMPISISLGLATRTSESDNLSKMLHTAEDNMYKNKLAESRSTRSAVVNSLLNALAEKSHETEAHTQRMQNVAARAGKQFGLADSELHRLKLLITLHDIGKINIPKEMLTRNGPLSSGEREVMKTHVEVGSRIARATQDFAHVADEIRSHHELWDGTGHPQGLKGKEIPLLARIVAIADAYEVMTYGRPYQASMPVAEVLAELRRCAGTQFDPELVEVFMSVLSPAGD